MASASRYSAAVSRGSSSRSSSLFQSLATYPASVGSYEFRYRHFDCYLKFRSRTRGPFGSITVHTRRNGLLLWF